MNSGWLRVWWCSIIAHYRHAISSWHFLISVFYSRVWFLVFCTVNTIVEVGAFDSLNALVNIWLHLTRGFDSSRIDQNVFVLPGFKHIFCLFVNSTVGEKIRVLRLGKTAVIAIFIIVYSFFFSIKFYWFLEMFSSFIKNGEKTVAVRCLFVLRLLVTSYRDFFVSIPAV